MVCQNMMLAAHSMGLGSCWVYFGQLIIDNPEISSILKLQEDEKVYGPIIIGYSKGDEIYKAPKKDADVVFI